MNRRGFFSSLFNSEPERFFLGIQVVFATLNTDTSAHQIRDIIADAMRQEKPQEKRALYKRVAAVLLEQQPYWEYGYWDYVPHDDDAIAEFEQWSNDIQSSMATEPEEIGAEIDEARRMSNDKYYVVVTMLFVLETASALVPVMDTIEEIAEEDYFTRAAFTALLEAVTAVDFEYCEQDAVFIMPGTDEDGFSWEDLRQAGWEYLKSLTW